MSVNQTWVLTAATLANLQACNDVGEVNRYLLQQYRHWLTALPAPGTVNALELRAVHMLSCRAMILNTYVACNRQVHQEREVALFAGFVSQLLHAKRNMSKIQAVLDQIVRCWNEDGMPKWDLSYKAGRLSDEFLSKMRRKNEAMRLLRLAVSNDSRLETFLDDILKHDSAAAVLPPFKAFTATYRDTVSAEVRQFLDELQAMLVEDIKMNTYSALLRLAMFMHNEAAFTHLSKLAARQLPEAIS